MDAAIVSPRRPGATSYQLHSLSFHTCIEIQEGCKEEALRAGPAIVHLRFCRVLMAAIRASYHIHARISISPQVSQDE